MPAPPRPQPLRSAALSPPQPAAAAKPARRFVDDYLLALLARASHAVSEEFHARLRARGVGVPVWRVLATLSGLPKGQGETVTGLARACLLQQPTMTKVLDRMERDGLVRRHPDLQDRRVVRLTLTPRGEATVAELLVAARAHEAEVLARHPPAEVEAIKALLRELIARQDRPRR
ncbi:MarR family winged helix-turn-helix transcriptional regulator [Caldovatus aquaticus]|uniref:MarR family transcriptional regulator n=1 Tax=Caldovatus aquaticus TaxID=2865671 RepID=A0ABS7F2T7_9PROT|nr:MarR family transcriptional regulator [Caldovatus aquaticus]